MLLLGLHVYVPVPYNLEYSTPPPPPPPPLVHYIRSKSRVLIHSKFVQKTSDYTPMITVCTEACGQAVFVFVCTNVYAPVECMCLHASQNCRVDMYHIFPVIGRSPPPPSLSQTQFQELTFLPVFVLFRGVTQGSGVHNKKLLGFISLYDNNYFPNT